MTVGYNLCMYYLGNKIVSCHPHGEHKERHFCCCQPVVLCLERLFLTSCWNIKLCFKKGAIYVVLISYLVSARNSPLAVSQTLSAPYTLHVLSPATFLCWCTHSQPLVTSARCLCMKPSRVSQAGPIMLSFVPQAWFACISAAYAR